MSEIETPVASPEAETPVAESETAIPESEVADAIETPENSDNSEEQAEPVGETKEGESDTPEEEALSGNKAKKRIGKLTAKNFAVERENERLRAQIAEATKSTGLKVEPKEDDYEDYAHYEDAKLDWKLDQREQSRAEEARKTSSVNEAKERQDTFHKRADVVRESREDFDEVAMAPELLDLYANEARHVAEILESHDLGPEIAYHLGENPDKVIELAQMSDRLAAIKIGELGAKLSAKPKTKAVSKAGTPITPIGGSGSSVNESNSGDPHGDNLSVKEWNAKEDAKERAKRA